jgi:cell division septal protein FtsQ
MQNVYISDVEFERVTPGRLYVTVTERRLTAYIFIEHTGSFLFLDEYGRVLEIRTFFDEPFPVLEGLHFTRFQLGEILDVPDTAAFNVIVQYAQLLNHHGLIHYVSHINVSDASNIRIRIYNIEFNVGGVTNADEKVRTIVAMLESMREEGLYPELLPGFVDMSDTAPEYFFTILQ